MAQTSTKNLDDTRGGVNTGNDLKIVPGQAIDKDVFVDVKSNAIRILANIPLGDSIEFYHVYNGGNDCVDVPDIPVMINNGQDRLVMHNTGPIPPDTNATLRNEIWLTGKGRYRMQYISGSNATVIPEDVYAWVQEDTAPCCMPRYNGYRN